MEKLFGIPMNDLMANLLVLFGVLTLVAIVIAVRNRLIVKMAIRNIPRRRAQTVLIVVGLMLATTLFSAAFAMGDTMTHSFRLLAVDRLGQVDVIVAGEQRDASGRQIYFDESLFDTVRDHLSSDLDVVEGVAPLSRETVSVLAPETSLSEPHVQVLAYDEAWMDKFDRLLDEDGDTLSLSTLGPEQVYITAKTAKELDVGIGDPIQIFAGPDPTNLQVAGIIAKGANPAGDLAIAMPLSRFQGLTGTEGKINNVIITNVGDSIKGDNHTDAVISSLKPLLEGTDLKAWPDKQDALERAGEIGAEFSTVFLVFGQFSVAAGILLIFLIFVMLAAERKRELGIARAVGAQRGHVIRLFAYEGVVYALIAAAVGSMLGVGVGLGMVFIIGAALAGEDFDIVFLLNWRSVIIAYTLGMVLTFAVVAFSSWRVSRLNIVRAIRDIPEPSISRKSLRGLILTSLIILGGIALAFIGYQSAQLAAFMLGTSLVIIGVPVLARRFGLPDRIAFSAAGVGLVVWWLLPFDALDFMLPEMEQDISMFFLSGIMLVIGGVWTVLYNSDLITEAAVRLLGRIGGLAPVLKTAVSYPMQNRLRTGMTLAMLSLIVFTLTVMGFVISGTDAVLEDPERISGGYHLRADSSRINPIPDMREALESTEAVNADDFDAIASFAHVRLKLKQEGSDKKPVDFWIGGVDAGYTDSVTHKFAVTAEGYDSREEVWKALQEEPGTAVVDYDIAPTRNDFNVGESGPDLRLEGFFVEDETLPDVYILAKDTRSGNEERLRVIGVLKDGSGYTPGVMTSQSTLNALMSEVVAPRRHMFRLNEGVDAEATAKTMEAAFLEHGLQTKVIAEEMRDEAGIEKMFNLLLQGFMGLGLVVGIAALGVIAARSVVERRQQIGMLRAIGFQKGMVQLSFLLESSFVALLGIALGIALGAILSYNLIDEIGKDVEGLAYRVPWLNVGVVVVIAYLASLLTTFLPARQASNVYPAEALRAE